MGSLEMYIMFWLARTDGVRSNGVLETNDTLGRGCLGCAQMGSTQPEPKVSTCTYELGNYSQINAETFRETRNGVAAKVISLTDWGKKVRDICRC